MLATGNHLSAIPVVASSDQEPAVKFYAQSERKKEREIDLEREKERQIDIRITALF